MFSSITVPAGRCIKHAGTGPKDIHILHDIVSALTGGYVSARVMMKKVGEALGESPVAVTSIARAADVVTVGATAHGLAVGDIAVIRNVVPGGADAFNGEFYVKAVPNADEFTYDQDGANDATATGGLVYGIPTLPYNGEGTHIKSADTTAGYHCRLANVNQDLWLQVHITDGTHTVRVHDAVAGTGSMHVNDGEIVVLGAVADAAVEGDTQGTVNAHLRGIDKEIGAVADAAVVAGASGTVTAKLRSISRDIGATDDAAVVAGAAGTLAAKTRSISRDVGATDDAAVEGDAAGTLSAKARGLQKAVGTTADAAVETDAAGTLKAHVRGLVAIQADLITATSAGAVQGAAADGAAAVGNPVQVGGVDGGGLAQALAVDTDGQAQVDVLTEPATVADAGALPAVVKVIGGYDGAAVQVIATDSDGDLQVDVKSGSITADTELPAAAALADNTATPTAPAVGAFGMVYDGATWDMAPGDSTNGADVDVTREPATVADGGALPGVVKVVGGYDGANVQALATDADGQAQVDVLTAPATAAEAAALPAVFAVVAGDDGTDTHPLQQDANGNLKVLPGAANTTQQLLGSTVIAVAGANQVAATVTGLGAFKQAMILLDVTAVATDAGDTLDVYIDTSPDGGTTWVNVIHFPQVLGNGAAAKHWATLDPSNPGTSTIDVTSDAVAGAARPAMFCDRFRVRYTAVEGGGADMSFTIAVQAFLKA